MGMLETVVIGLAVIGFILYRSFTKQPVTTKSVLLPLVGAVVLATRYTGPVDVGTVALLGGGAVVGLAAGGVSGLVVKVWQDASGVIYRSGGWAFLITLVALIAVRIGLRFVLVDAGVAADLVTESFISMMLGTYVGRTLVITARALALAGGDLSVLDAAAPTRLARSHKF